MKRYEAGHLLLKDILLYFEIIDLPPFEFDKELFYNGFLRMESYDPKEVEK